MPGGGLKECALRHEPNDLAPRGGHAERLGFHLDHLVGAVERGGVEVHKVHRDLCLAVHDHPKALHALEASRGAAHGLRDGLGDAHVLGAAQVDVVGHEEGAGADDRGARGGVDGVGAEVGGALGVLADLFLGELELAATDVGEVGALGGRGGALVEEDGDLEFAADALAQGAREDNAIFHRRPFERDEGADVGGADARVRAGVLVEVDQFGGLGDAAECGLDGDFDRGHEGADGAIVVGVAREVENNDSLNAGDGVADGGDGLEVSAFGEVRDAFDKRHRSV